jgi:hypothetical protein
MEKYQNIQINMEVVKGIIDEISANHKEFSTIDVIRKYLGNYRNNSIKYVAPKFTFNSQFGKLLKDNMGDLNIEEVEDNVDTKDDDGKKTTTSIWKTI